MVEQIDTHYYETLKRRSYLNNKGTLYKFEDWVIKQCKPYPEMRVLELGCGTGKHTFPFAEQVSPAGSILGIDISQEAVTEVNEKANSNQLKHIRAVKGSFDECVNLLHDSKFDLILSCYAIYYAEDMKRVLCALRSLLSPKGHIFICGYGKGNNQEIFNIINHVIPNPREHRKSAGDFIDESSIEEIGKCYQRFSTVRLYNKIQFNGVDDVLEWWKNHPSYLPEIYDQVKGTLQSIFALKGNFVLTKSILGVNYYS
ncbi:MAG TPA: class I SAM-dependent methyltransferase [Nitrososphaeraceae archaeon]